MWALSGFGNATVWLIFAAFIFSLGYAKTGFGKRIALLLIRAMGRRTLGLGYAIALADLALAPFMPSNTARSGGTIFPILRNIPELYGSLAQRRERAKDRRLSDVHGARRHLRHQQHVRHGHRSKRSRRRFGPAHHSRDPLVDRLVPGLRARRFSPVRARSDPALQNLSARNSRSTRSAALGRRRTPQDGPGFTPKR